MARCLNHVFSRDAGRFSLSITYRPATHNQFIQGGAIDLSKSHLDSANTCSCEVENRFPSVPAGGCLKFEDILELNRHVFLRLAEINRCKKCSSDLRSLRDTVGTLRDLLPIFEAAEVTYFGGNKEYESSYTHNRLGPLPTLSSSASGSKQALICERSPMAIGRLSLSQVESDLISRRATSILVCRLGRELKEIKRQIKQDEAFNAQRKFRTISKEYTDIGETISHALVRAYTMIARMRI
jgi:hypothetical protein